MSVRDLTRASLAALSLILLLAGCGKAPPAIPPPPPPPPGEAPGLRPAPKAEPIILTLQAAADVNPDSTNRPSPVVVRIYLLKSETGFNAADFFALYDDEKAALKEDLIARSTEFTLRPGENISVPQFVPTPEARFLGVIAAYRDYRNAQWRLAAPLPLAGKNVVTIGRARIELSAR